MLQRVKRVQETRGSLQAKVTGQGTKPKTSQIQRVDCSLGQRTSTQDTEGKILTEWKTEKSYQTVHEHAELGKEAMPRHTDAFTNSQGKATMKTRAVILQRSL